MLGGNLRSHSLASSGLRCHTGTGARARQQQPGKGGWRSGPMAHQHPAKRKGSLWGHSTTGGRPSGSDSGWMLPMARNPAKSTLLWLTVPATVAGGYLGPAPPATRSADALQTGRSASAPHSARAPPPGGQASPRCGAHWLGQQGSAPGPAPPAAPPPSHRLPLASQVRKVAAASKPCSCWPPVAK